jgi:hypothetical protein
MEVVARLRAAGDLGDAADVLEDGVRYTTSSGWEWLGELARAAREVRRRYRTPPEIREALDALVRTARSRTPYGE